MNQGHGTEVWRATKEKKADRREKSQEKRDQVDGHEGALPHVIAYVPAACRSMENEQKEVVLEVYPPWLLCYSAHRSCLYAFISISTADTLKGY